MSDYVTSSANDEPTMDQNSMQEIFQLMMANSPKFRKEFEEYCKQREEDKR